MRICYFGTFDPAYVRNRTLIEGLERAGAEVCRCHAPVWRGTDDRIGKASRSAPRTLWQLARAQALLLKQYASAPAHDAIVVGYPGHADMLAARLCSRRRHKPLVFDAFLSLYETAIEDRHLAKSRSIVAAAMRAGDRLATRAADIVVLDTEQHVDYFRRTISAHSRYAIVPVSAEDAYLDVPPSQAGSGPLRVVYFGAYIPLHGIETVLGAADLLRDQPVHFVMLGRGQMLPQAQALAHDGRLGNVAFDTGWYSPQALCERLIGADVCLGVFAPSDKAARVVPNKVAAALATARPVVTADTPAARSLLHDGTDALLCAPGDAQALADSLLRLLADRQLAPRIGAAGKRLFLDHLSIDAVGRRFHALLLDLAA